MAGGYGYICGDWCFQGKWGCRLVVLSHSLIISVVVVWYSVSVVSAHSAQKRNWTLIAVLWTCGNYSESSSYDLQLFTLLRLVEIYYWR